VEGWASLGAVVVTGVGTGVGVIGDFIADIKLIK